MAHFAPCQTENLLSSFELYLYVKCSQNADECWHIPFQKFSRYPACLKQDLGVLAQKDSVNCKALLGTKSKLADTFRGDLVQQNVWA